MQLSRFDVVLLVPCPAFQLQFICFSMLPAFDIVKGGKKLVGLLAFNGRLLEPLDVEAGGEVADELFSLHHALLDDLP